eukprot:3934650-Karenia_brevis.AAC.1
MVLLLIGAIIATSGIGCLISECQRSIDGGQDVVHSWSEAHMHNKARWKQDAPEMDVGSRFLQLESTLAVTTNGQDGMLGYPLGMDQL